MFGFTVEGLAARFCRDARRGPSRLFNPAIPMTPRLAGTVGAFVFA